MQSKCHNLFDLAAIPHITAASIDNPSKIPGSDRNISSLDSVNNINGFAIT